MSEETQQPPVQTPPPAAAPQVAPATTVVPSVPAPATAPTQNIVVQTPAKPAPLEVAPAAAQPPAPANYPGKDLGLKPIVAPPLPISADKQARLQALTAQYIANQISPEEYFKQREEILAEP
jgi:hypothetical protein